MYLLANIDTGPTVLKKLLDGCHILLLSTLKSLAVMQNKLLIGLKLDFPVDVVHPCFVMGHVLHASAYGLDTS